MALSPNRGLLDGSELVFRERAIVALHVTASASTMRPTISVRTGALPGTLAAM